MTEWQSGESGRLGAAADAASSGHALAMVGDAKAARAALSPLRRELLLRLREPGSAATLSEAMMLPRQRIGYHLKVLAEAGLIVAAGERRKRGFTEHLFEARSDALIVDPLILGAADPESVDKQDVFAAEHLVGTAARIVGEVSRMREAASDEGRRLLTFTLEADVAFAAPADIALFSARLADALAGLAAEFAPEPGQGANLSRHRRRPSGGGDENRKERPAGRELRGERR